MLTARVLAPVHPRFASLRLILPLILLWVGLRAQTADRTTAPTGIEAAPEAIAAFAHEYGRNRDVKIFTRASTRAAFDDNLFTSPTQKVSDSFVDTSVDVAGGLGPFTDQLEPASDFRRIPDAEEAPPRPYLFARWTPDWIWFVHRSDQDRVNHEFSVSGATGQEKFQLAAQALAQSLSNTVVDVGTRVDRTVYSGSGVASYAVAPKSTLQFSLSEETDRYAHRLTTEEWASSFGVIYEVLPKTRLGLAGSYGTLSIHPGSSQAVKQVLVQGSYEPTEKLTFSGQVGTEFRSFNQDASDRQSLVFDTNAHLQWSPQIEGNLHASRRTRGSAQDAAQNVVDSLYEFELRERLFHNYSASAKVALQSDDFYDNRVSGRPPRSDQLHVITMGIAADLTSHGIVRLFYEYRENHSTSANFTFSQNRAGAESTFLF